MSMMANKKRLIEYYVVRNKSTGFYFRGKGANRWGEYHNQASIYRIRAQAENTANWLNLRGEPVEIVPIKIVENPTVDAVEVEKYKALVEMYHDLRENFIDYYCSGTQNVAPYCLNKCEECVDKWGYCKQYSDYCKGFNPAEVILDGEMDGDGNG